MQTAGIILLSLLVGCMDYEPTKATALNLGEGGVFVVSEGNFTYGNSSVEHYSPQRRALTSDVFGRANARALGDVAQSMSYFDGLCYIVVNNSGVIYIINPWTGLLTGGIKGLTSPRYMYFVGADKAYVTDLVAERINIINPVTRKIVGNIPTPGHKSTEQIVRARGMLWVSCWSYDNTLLVIDPSSDRVVQELRVGLQPTSLAVDAQSNLWSVSTGGYAGSTYGHEAPSLRRINTETQSVEQVYTFPMDSQLGALATSPRGDVLYYLLSGAVYAHTVGRSELPDTPLIPATRASASKPYGLGVDPVSGDIYVADAIDYVQQGVIYRYNAAGEALDTLRVGINPSSFCFVPKQG